MPGRDVDIGYAEWGPEEKERLNAALQSSAVRDIAPTLGIVVVAIGITYFYLNSQINHWLFDVWALVSILVQVFRFGCMTRIARHPITKRSYNIVMLCQVLGGSVWAALLFFWNNEMSLGMQLMFVLAPIGLCLGSVTSAGAWPPFSIAIIVSSKLPFFLYHMVAQPAGLLTVAVPMLVFTVLDLTLLRNYHLRARESFELRIRNERLINNLTTKNTHLKHAEQQALQASEAKGNFLARMSHEMRTPINGVIGGADMLSRTAMDSSQRQWLETIRSSSGDMLRLVDQLLDHSSMNEGRFSLQNRVFNLHDSVVDCVQSQQKHHPKACIDVHLSDSVPTFVVADNQRVTQVLNHLIDNARKFSDDGQIDVFIDIDENGDQPASDTSSVRFAVKDDGIGIPEHKIEALFTDLEQVDGSMSRRYGGSGLGLTLTRQLIKLMGGELHVESIEGKGSTFAAVLPFALAKDDCQENMGAADFSDVSVLVAEDNPVNQVVLEAMLEELGCQVTLADDGGEALVAMTGTDFDMVFMDCQMPEMDGLEATSAARRQGVEVPIVAITANALYGDRERCIESGMNDYVTKPVTQRTIVNLLDRWAGERQRPLTAVGE